MKLLSRILFVLLFFPVFCSKSFAVDLPGKIVLKTDFQIWDMYVKSLDLISDYEKNLFNSFDIKILENQSEYLAQYIHLEESEGIDLMKVKRYLKKKIAPDIYREGEDVTIDMDENGIITFDGNGLYARELDIEKAAVMIKSAIENDIRYVNLPVIRKNPTVTVLSDELKEMGITELISSGETDFSGSPRNRIHNINIGLSRFNGHIINPDDEFVFGNTLGRVGPATGFKKELVIKGSKTIPEYGGGLCQVSTTAFRGALAAGLPITKRRNHSYAVNYYTPHGLDATVYPPSVDLKFVNDSGAHILMQTLTIGNNAYWNYYGTNDNREIHMIGPYYSNWKKAPATKTEYTTNLAPGETTMLGHSVPGLNATWYRQVEYDNTDKKEDEIKESSIYTIFSKYQARPNYYLIGTSQSVNPDESDLENGY